VHCGKVVIAEIDDIKKDIVYNGDVLNTASRIQSVCNKYGERLLV
jgi:adenylate cyclase